MADKKRDYVDISMDVINNNYIGIKTYEELLSDINILLSDIAVLVIQKTCLEMQSNDYTVISNVN